MIDKKVSIYDNSPDYDLFHIPSTKNGTSSARDNNPPSSSQAYIPVYQRSSSEKNNDLFSSSQKHTSAYQQSNKNASNTSPSFQEYIPVYRRSSNTSSSSYNPFDLFSVPTGKPINNTNPASKISANKTNPEVNKVTEESKSTPQVPIATETNTNDPIAASLETNENEPGITTTAENNENESAANVGKENPNEEEISVKEENQEQEENIEEEVTPNTEERNVIEIHQKNPQGGIKLKLKQKNTETTRQLKSGKEAENELNSENEEVVLPPQTNTNHVQKLHQASDKLEYGSDETDEPPVPKKSSYYYQPSLSVGENLKEFREGTGLTLSQVAESTYIREDYLLNMENNSLNLPYVYLVSYIRKLCDLYRVSKEDADSLVTKLEKKESDNEEELSTNILEKVTTDPVVNEEEEKRVKKFILITGGIIIGILLLLIIAIIYFVFRTNQEQRYPRAGIGTSRYEEVNSNISDVFSSDTKLTDLSLNHVAEKNEPKSTGNKPQGSADPIFHDESSLEKLVSPVMLTPSQLAPSKKPSIRK